MKQITAADFKATCLSPFAADSSELIGALAGRIQISGDLLSTGADWHAES
jgi:hypothetical protein